MVVLGFVSQKTLVFEGRVFGSAGTVEVVLELLMLRFAVFFRSGLVLDLLQVGLAGRTGKGGPGQSPRNFLRSQKLISQQLIDGGPIRWVEFEHLHHELLGHIRDLRVGKAVIANLDLLVGGLDLVGFEGRLPEQQGVGDDPQTPDVDLVGVSLFACMRSTVLSSISGAM